MATVTTLATVALVFTDTAINVNTGVLAATTGTLTITALLALAAPLAAWFGREIFLVCTKLVLEVHRGPRDLAARVRAKGRKGTGSLVGWARYGGLALRL